MSDQRKKLFSGMKSRCLSVPMLIVILLAIGAPFTWWMIARADHQLRAELQQQTRLMARVVNMDRIKALSGTEADMASPNYQALKEQLTAVRSANPQFRFAYLMGRKADGQVFFFVDSEPPGSADYSPPGQAYEEAPEGDRRAFETKSEVFEGPLTDRWGVWVSALVPLLDPDSGDVVAVLGVDVDARTWKWDVAARAALPVGLTLVLFISVVSFVFASRRIDKSPKPVLRRLMPTFAVMVTLLIIGALALLWRQQQQHLNGEIAADIFDVSCDLKVALDQQATGMLSAVETIAANPDFKKTLRAGEAESLLSGWKPLFEVLRQDCDITHLYFYDPKRICLLRVHNPEKRGDRIDRFTAREAERTGKACHGLELGPLGTFTLRVVQPVYEDGALIGYLELGKEIEGVLPKLSLRSGAQLAVSVHKNLLNRENWEKRMRVLGREAVWDRLPEDALIYASQSHLPDVFLPWVRYRDDIPAHTNKEHEVAFDGKDWRVSVAPLKDAAGNQVGSLLIMHDTSTEKMALERMLTLSGTGGGVLLAVLLGFVHVLLYRTDAGIRAQHMALMESEESYRNQFQNNSAVMMLVAPLDGSIIDANAAALRFYGYPRERLLSMRITDINTLPSSEVKQAMASVPQTEGRLFEFQHILANGSRRDVEVSAINIQFGGRDVISSIIHDVTNRKRAEAGLLEAEWKFRALFEKGPIGVAYHEMIYDASGKPVDYRFVDANESYQALTGIDPRGKTVLEAFPGIENDPFDWIGTYGHVARSGKSIHFEQYLQLNDRWYDCVAYQYKQDHFVAAFFEITERKRAQESLHIISIAIESSVGAVALADLHGSVTYVNPACVSLWGYEDKDEMIGKSVFEFWAYPKNAETIFAEVSQGGVENSERLAKKKDGTSFNVYVSVHLVRDDSGNPFCIMVSAIDITARKQAEAALGESEYLFRTLFNAVTDALFVTDFGKDSGMAYFMEVNEVACRRLGYTREELLQTIPYEIDTPETRLDPDSPVIRKLEAGEEVIFEKIQIAKDGTRIPVEIHAKPFVFRGKPAVIALVRDVTVRKQAEAALRESELLLREAQIIARMGSYVLDISTGAWSSSEELDKLFGIGISYERSIEGWLDLVHPEDRAMMDNHFRNEVVALGRDFNKEYRIIRHDNQVECWVHGMGKLEFDAQGIPVRMWGAIQNIAERKQAEAQMQLQSSALEASANAIVITNAKGVIEWANAAFTTFTGYSVAEAIGKTPRMLNSGKHEQAFYRALWETVLAGEVWHGELINRRKDGTFYTEDMTITPMKDNFGTVKHFIAVKQDITERKRMEENLLRTERMESIGRLAAGVAHDINNILTPIFLSVGMLRGEEDAETRECFISSIEECAHRGADVVGQVLTFARGTTGERTTLQLSRQVDAVEKIIRETFPRNITITSSIPEELWPVKGDPTHIYQVLLNLCINARDAMPDGGTLFVSAQNRTVDEAFAAMSPDAKTGDYAMLSVSDSGTGIPREIISKIFDPFFTTKNFGQGTGLGLSTVIGIVRSHGGFVTVDSDENQGSTFKVFLPRATCETAEQKTLADSQTPLNKGGTILLVDDESFIAKVTSMVLEKHGYKVFTAAEGTEALALYREHAKEIDLVLTDIMMPGMDGVKVAKALKAMAPRLKIIASTGQATETRQAELRALGVNVIMSKPYEVEELLATLHEAIHGQSK